MPAKRMSKKPESSRRSYKPKAKNWSSYRSIGRGTTTTMVNRSRLRDHTVVADRFMTKVSASYCGVAATASLTNSQFIIYGNSGLTPFTTPSNNIGAVFTATQSSTIATPPMGWSGLSTLYQSYRVRSARIKITIQPTDVDDTCALIVYPSGSSLFTTPPRIHTNQRYSKYKICTPNNNVKENTIINYVSSHEALGLSQAQYEALPPVPVGQAPPTGYDWYWVVIIDQLDGTTNDANITCLVEVDYYVEMSEPATLSS